MNRRVRDPFLYTGLLGSALLCLRAYEATGDTTDLHTAADIIAAADEAAQKHHTYFSFFCGQPGILSLGAVVSSLLHRPSLTSHYMDRLSALLLHPSVAALPSSPSDPAVAAPAALPNELLYGRSGLLWSLLFLHTHARTHVRSTVATSTGTSSGGSGDGGNPAMRCTTGAAAAAKSPLTSVPLPALELARPLTNAVLASGRALARAEFPDTGRGGGQAGVGGGEGGTRPPPLMFSWHDSMYWGAAHGLAGIAHVLLQLAVVERREEREREGRQGATGVAAQGWIVSEEARRECEELLLWMAGGRFSTGNYPSSEEGRQRGRDRLVHWCHGAPGVAMAMAGAAAAAAEMGSPNASPLLLAASSACDVVWHRGLLTRIGLCHGIAGNTYAFLSLHRALQALSPSPSSLIATSSSQPSLQQQLEQQQQEHHRRQQQQQQQHQQVWRARAFASFLLQNWEQQVSSGIMHAGDRPYSLMEGLAGVSCLFLDMARPHMARFPGFDL